MRWWASAPPNPPAPGDTFTAWTYDPVGNRLSERTYQGTAMFTYDAADRLVSASGPGSAGTQTYTYDPNGNQTAAGPNTFAYDLADRLTSATVGGTTETYTWSGDGVRLSATSGNGPSGTVRFQLDRAFELPQVALERDGNDKLLRRYTYGLDLLSQTTSNKGPYWYHHDGLGSVTDVTSATGTSLWWMEYTPFGAPRASGSTSQAPVNLFRFSGAYFDTVTALYHLRARQYDPSLGRFLSPDPVSQAIARPCVSTYSYARNNPVRFVDPSGLESQSATASRSGYNVGECLSGILGFYGFGLAGLAQVAGGALLQGFSVTLFGVTFGGVAPVTAGGIVAGLGLEVSGVATEVAGVALVYKACVSQ